MQATGTHGPPGESCLPFSNSNPQSRRTDIIMSAIARNRMKNWEVIADNLSKAGWSWAVSQPSTLTDKQSSLLTPIATNA